MKLARKLALLAGVATFAIPMMASADMTFEFTTVVSGDTPSGDAPWATLLCQDTGVDEVTFTLTHSATSTAGQFLTELMLNYDGTIPGNFDIASTNPSVTGAGFGEDAYNDAGSAYDIQLLFETSNSGGLRVEPGDSVVFTITGTGVDCLDFNVLSTPNGDGVGQLALLHVQGTFGQEGSSKIAPVPEPASMAALAIGALGMLARRRRSR